MGRRSPGGFRVFDGAAYNGSPRDGRTRCLICGRELHFLGSHLRVHSLTSADYWQLFPGAPLVSDNLRAIRTAQKRDRDGDPYWTADRIIAAMRAWAGRTGSTPTYAQWGRRRKTKTHPSGFPAGGRSRPTAATVEKVFGSWTAAVDAAGLEHPSMGRKYDTHCRNGHERTPENAYRISTSGHWICRVCRAERAKKLVSVTCPVCGESRELQAASALYRKPSICIPCCARENAVKARAALAAKRAAADS